MTDQEAVGFVAKHKDEWETFEQNGQTKLRCKLTGHEMGLSMAQINAHMGGKRYKQKSRSRENGTYDFSQHAPHITETKSGMLRCQLTTKVFAKDATVLAKHLAGRRFRNALLEFKRKEESKTPAGSDKEESAEEEGSNVELDEEHHSDAESVASDQSFEREFGVEGHEQEEAQDEEQEQGDQEPGQDDEQEDQEPEQDSTEDKGDEQTKGAEDESETRSPPIQQKKKRRKVQ